MHCDTVSGQRDGHGRADVRDTFKVQSGGPILLADFQPLLDGSEPPRGLAAQPRGERSRADQKGSYIRPAMLVVSKLQVVDLAYGSTVWVHHLPIK
ncbi:hypothetical protein ABZ341_35870 [Streptomyces sp. NPDC006173]|uniref:hypothetical protein n=1 Tax=Streptomyces sp. NPDC006173 TaxID=3155349 RepID=UPI0033DBCDDB